jgi:phosphonate metabolism protein PhnN/1,5-bisphosphokinase (PRPP-forming)
MATVRTQAAEMRTGEGALVVIVGPSGSGKDALINWLRDYLEGRSEFLFVRRTVTREADSSLEDHDTMSVAEFRMAEAAGHFAATWTAHGLHYGLPAIVHDHIGRGGVAIANGARRALPDLRERFERLHVVNVVVEPAVLAERLAARRRESAADIEARLKQAALQADAGPDVVDIDNSGPIDIAGRRVLAVLSKLTERKAPAAGDYSAISSAGSD